MEITLAPFADAKALYQAVLEEAKNLKVDAQTDIDVNLIKDLFCVGLSSKKIEAALAVCMKRATYNSLRITDEVFEPEEARNDYFVVCLEVAKRNLAPFTKDLYAEYSQVLGQLKSFPK